MGKLYDNLITTTAGFKYNAKQPLDDRDVVQSYSDLQTLIDGNMAYEGMEVYVVDNKKSYKFVGETWKAIATEDYVEQKTEEDPTVPAWAKAENKPTYSYDEITGKPELFSGSYNDLTDKPTIPSIDGLVSSDDLADVATSGDYNDLINTPTIPTQLSQLTGDSTHRTVTDAEKTTWNAKSDFSGSYTDLTNKPNIPDALSDLTDDTAHRTVTDAEKATWNAKSDFSGSYNDLTDVPTDFAASDHNHDDRYYIESEVDTAVQGAKDYAKGLVDALPANAEYTIVKDSSSSDYAAVYHLTKDGANVGVAINIPKDMVVESGSVVTNPTGQSAGTYIKLVLQNVDEPLYINVGSLIEYVTSGSVAGDMVYVNISDDHKVTATITDGTITLAKLDASVQAAINSIANKADVDDIPTDYISTGSATQCRVGGLVLGQSTVPSGVNAKAGRIYVTGDNPLFGLKDTASGTTQFFLQVSGDKLFLGPTSSKALEFASTGATTVPSTFTSKGLVTANNGVQTNKVQAPTTSGGSTYGVGLKGQVLKSNGTTVYWGDDENKVYDAATTSADGLMSSADKNKLDGIDDNANNYTHPSTHAASMITGLADVATSGSYNDLADKPTTLPNPNALTFTGAATGTYDGSSAQTINIPTIAGEDGKDGEDGKTPYIQDGYWYIDGKSTSVKAEGVDGAAGADGVGISSIVKTSTNGNVDTYTVTLTNGSTTTFTVTNGEDGDTGATGADGKGISEIYVSENITENNGYTETPIQVRYTDGTYENHTIKAKNGTGASEIDTDNFVVTTSITVGAPDMAAGVYIDKDSIASTGGGWVLTDRTLGLGLCSMQDTSVPAAEITYDTSNNFTAAFYDSNYTQHTLTFPKNSGTLATQEWFEENQPTIWESGEFSDSLYVGSSLTVGELGFSTDNITFVDGNGEYASLGFPSEGGTIATQEWVAENAGGAFYHHCVTWSYASMPTTLGGITMQDKYEVYIDFYDQNSAAYTKLEDALKVALGPGSTKVVSGIKTVVEGSTSTYYQIYALNRTSADVYSVYSYASDNSRSSTLITSLLSSSVTDVVT